MVELEDRIRHTEIDLIMIQESKLCSKDRNTSLPGYSTIRKDREYGRGGGLITFIKEDIPFIVKSNEDAQRESLLEMLKVEICDASLHKITCANVYCPPTRGALQGQEFQTSELPSAENTLIGGDLNAHSNTWDQWQPEDGMDRKIEDWLLNNNFSVANDGSATRVNVGTGGKSAPDITLVHSSWLEKTEWSPTDCMGSDHLPILVTIDCQIEALKVQPVMELRWNWKRADMVGFAAKVDDNLRPISENPPKRSLEARATHLNRIILESAASSIGKVKATSNGKQWLTREIRDAIKNH